MLNCKAGCKWERISCLRWIDGTPIAWTDIYVLPRHKAVVNSIGEGTKPVFQLLLDEFDETVANVRIEMFASRVTPEMAEALDIDVGASAMTIVRRYVGNRDRTFEVSVSVHPEGRFTYAMDLEREWGVRGWRRFCCIASKAASQLRPSNVAILYAASRKSKSSRQRTLTLNLSGAVRGCE